MNIKNIIKRVEKVVFFLLSYSPLLCVSDDSNFGSNERGLDEYKERLRISLISIYLGAYRYYFFSFKINKNRVNFKKIHKISLFDIIIFTNDDRVRLIDIQKDYLKNNNDVQVDKEFLLYLIENQNNRKNNSNNKINIYTTILLALIPMIIIFYKPEQFIKGNLSMRILTILLFYILVNISLFILQVNKVLGYYREKYSDLKKSNDKNRDIVMSYYLDYQSIKKEADRLVSFVKNIEIYIIGAIICILLLTLFNYKNNNESKYINHNGITKIYKIDISGLENHDNNSVKIINEVNEKVPDNDTKKILIIYSNDEILKDKSFNSIISYFNIYRKRDDIILLKENDNIKDDKIKIILLRE